jgi:HD-like signal output (HDOD) protein
MDWLRKYDGVILCAKRAIRLTKEDGTIVEFNVAMQADQASLLNQVQGTSLDEIRVVQKYPNVFPEDLPGSHQIATSSL